MSTTTIRARFKPEGVLTDADSVVLSAGVVRRDTNAVVVPVGTAMVRASVGSYSYTFTDPAPGLEYVFDIAYAYGTQTITEQRSIRGGHGGNLYDLLPRIMPHAGGAGDPFVKQQLRMVARDFCQQTEIWREDLATIDSVVGQADYDLEHGYDAEILRVRWVTYNKLSWCFDLDAGATVVTLCPAPTRADLPIVVSVAFLPLETCTAYPAWLLRRYGQAIVEGTKARLCSMTGKPWFNAQVAADAGMEFRRLMGEAKMDNQTKKGPGHLRYRPGRFV